MSIDGGGGFDLDNLLDEGLQHHVGALQGPSPLPAQSAYHAVFTAGGNAVSVFSTVTAALTTKAAAAVAAVAIVGGGAAVGTVATGSPNPLVWGQTVVAAVQGCKVSEGTGDESAKTASTARDNVGQCVSAAAKKKGEAERAKHSQAPATHPTGKPTDLPGGKPTDLPGGKPTDVPSGKPTDVPVGKPADVPPTSAPTGHKP